MGRIDDQIRQTDDQLLTMFDRFDDRFNQTAVSVQQLRRVLAQVDPRAALRRGYAILRGTQAVGEVVEIETNTAIMKATVMEYMAYDKK